MAHHQYIPDVSSARYKVLLAAFNNGGSITLDQAAEKLQAEHQRSVVRGALVANDERGLMNRDVNLYTIAGYIRDHFEKVVAAPKEIWVGEPAAPRTGKPFQPLKSLPWQQHLDKIRDMTFHTASGAFQPLGYRA